MRNTALTKPRGRALAGVFDQLYAFRHGGVSGNAFEIAQLKNAQAQRDTNFQIELGLRPPGEMVDQKIELALIPQAAEDQSLGQPGVARIEGRGFLAQ